SPPSRNCIREPSFTAFRNPVGRRKHSPPSIQPAATILNLTFFLAEKDCSSPTGAAGQREVTPSTCSRPADRTCGCCWSTLAPLIILRAAILCSIVKEKFLPPSST